MASRLIDIRKLVALDIILHGRPFILTEFGLGTLLAIVLGLQLIYSGSSSGDAASLAVGAYLVLIGVNYVPLLIYAIIISKKNSAENEAESEIQQKSNYNKQQFLILIPLLVFLITVVQELKRNIGT